MGMNTLIISFSLDQIVNQKGQIVRLNRSYGEMK